LKKSFKIITEN